MSSFIRDIATTSLDELARYLSCSDFRHYKKWQRDQMRRNEEDSPGRKAKICANYALDLFRKAFRYAPPALLGAAAYSGIDSRLGENLVFYAGAITLADLSVFVILDALRYPRNSLYNNHMSSEREKEWERTIEKIDVPDEHVPLLDEDYEDIHLDVLMDSAAKGGLDDIEKECVRLISMLRSSASHMQ